MSSVQPQIQLKTVSEVISEQKASVREQLRAAWRIHLDRIEEELAAGWRDFIERVFDERFEEMARRMEEEMRAALEARSAEGKEAAAARAKEEAVRSAGEQFNQVARQLRQAESAEEVYSILLSAITRHCRRAAIFAVEGDRLKGVRAAGFEDHAGGSDFGNIDVSLGEAPAFATLMETGDTVITMQTASELSPRIASFLGESLEKRAHLFPIFTGKRAVAILYAGGGDAAVNSGAVELLAALATASFEARRVAQEPRPATFVTIAPGDSKPATSNAKEWSAIPRAEQDVHLRAQRYARVQVAEIRLYQANAVKAGRARRNLYAELKVEIDSCREAYRSEFREALPTIPDYFHLELVRTLANDDASLLGPDYPGSLA